MSNDLKIIDVSEHQGKIDWEKVKPQINGAIIRCGFGQDIQSQDDDEFKRNADECTRLCIPFGVYLYSYADNEQEAISEAQHVLRLVHGYELSYPIYYDVEEAGKEHCAKTNAIAFGGVIEKAGYSCGVYANRSWWETHLAGLDKFTKWVAEWSAKPTYKGKYLDMWQYSSKGKISGIKGNVDMNIGYRMLPGMISKKQATKNKLKSKPKSKPKQGLKVGDVVEFKGGNHHVSATSSKGSYVKPSKARVTAVAKGTHPYHLRKVNDNGSYVGGGVYGWVDTSTIKDVVNSSPRYNIKVTANILNVRKGAGTNFSITCQIKKNEIYTIVGENNGWGKLISGAGWICLKYTKKI